MDRETLSKLSAWMGFVGIMTIIAGVFSAIAGLFAFIIGAVPGIITIILGVKLRNAKQNADAMIAGASIEEDATNFNLFVTNLNTYFKIQGILIIVSLAMAVIGIVIGLAVGIGAFMYQGSFM